jgi:hypothetical protein
MIGDTIGPLLDAGLGGEAFGAGAGCTLRGETFGAGSEGAPAFGGVAGVAASIVKVNGKSETISWL